MVTETATSQLIDALPEEVGISSERLERVPELVQRYVDDGRFAGAITMIARRDRVIHPQTFGSMDDEAGKAMRADAIVQAYSMTKPIASVALMQLYEQSLFQLDDPVSAYVPEFAGLAVFDGGDEHKLPCAQARPRDDDSRRPERTPLGWSDGPTRPRSAGCTGRPACVAARAMELSPT